ncbi:MAG TPA: CARDB domain-containing protein [Candidatus Paceibacterota bacterium]|nr:CARDB domain-containing protein [Candidatus Paceibacterota bacterium]
METHETTTTKTTSRSPAVTAFAVVGVIALILLGIGLAVYAVRYLPEAMSGLGEAAVSLSRNFSGDDADVEVIDQPATPRDPGVVVTIPIGEETPAPGASPAPAATPSAPAAPAYTAPAASAPAPFNPTFPQLSQTPTTRPVAQAPAAGFGSPDLTVEILAVGYVTRDGASSTFREASRVPRGEQGAVRFRLSNRGTNESGRYEYEVRVRNEDNRTDTASGRAPSLGAGQSVISYAYFDARRSGDAEIDIEIDSGGDVRESNERNNTDSDDVEVRN